MVFSVQVANWVRKTKPLPEKFMRAYVVEIASELIKNTPVKTGLLRGSWVATRGGPSRRKGRIDKSGAATLAAIKAVSTSLKSGGQFFLTNTAPYADRIEFGYTGPDSLGRTYNIPATAFIRTVMARTDEIEEKVAAKIRRKAGPSKGGVIGG